MGSKNAIKNAVFSRHKFKAAALALPEQMNGFIKRAATLLNQAHAICQRRRLSDSRSGFRRRAYRAATHRRRIHISAKNAAKSQSR